MAHVFATLILTSDLLADIDPREELGLDLHMSDAWAGFVSSAYHHTHGFCYNLFHAQGLDVVYAGGEFRPWTITAHEVWVDYVLVRNRKLKLASLHVHIRFPDIGVELGRGDPRLTAVIAFIRDGLWSSDSGPASIPRLQGLVARILSPKELRNSSLPFSRYAYVSVIRPIAASGQRRTRQLVREQGDIYRLLFLTENAISPSLASHYNDAHSWSAEEFFRVYYQPGGIVTVAEPYPSEIQAQRPDWFLPTPPKPPPPLKDPPAPDGHAWHYNHLPEYPPLRFLAVPALDFAAGAEETLRDVHHEVMSAFEQLSRPAPRLGLRALGRQLALIAMPATISRLTYRMHAVENLEAIRLPVARQLVARLLDAQLTEPTRKAISTLSQQGVSASNSLLALIAALLAVIPLIIGTAKFVQAELQPTAALPKLVSSTMSKADAHPARDP